jgi:CSN8/PSMD8/EIF3K family
LQAYAAFQRVAKLVKLYWNRAYSQIWPLLSQKEWPEPVQGMVHGLGIALRQHMVALINKAYSTVLIATAASMLGLTREELLAGALRSIVYQSI